MKLNVFLCEHGLYMFFLISRNPNGPGLTNWSPYTNQSESFKQLSMTNTTNGNHYRKEEMEMWGKIEELENSTSGVPDIQRGPIFISMLVCCFAIIYRYI